MKKIECKDLCKLLQEGLPEGTEVQLHGRFSAHTGSNKLCDRIFEYEGAASLSRLDIGGLFEREKIENLYELRCGDAVFRFTQRAQITFCERTSLLGERYVADIRIPMSVTSEAELNIDQVREIKY